MPAQLNPYLTFNRGTAYFSGVGTSFQLMGILEYTFGLNPGSASTLNQNPIFVMASIINFRFYLTEYHNIVNLHSKIPAS